MTASTARKQVLSLCYFTCGSFYSECPSTMHHFQATTVLFTPLLLRNRQQSGCLQWLQSNIAAIPTRSTLPNPSTASHFQASIVAPIAHRQPQATMTVPTACQQILCYFACGKFYCECSNTVYHFQAIIAHSFAHQQPKAIRIVSMAFKTIP